ncbi:MAG: hypothetical protein HY323_08055 [Betaproteobacteria bacterium]|nr:hypothetical protein [Betaproteobacteria bacterium]
MTTYGRTERLEAIQKAGFPNPLTALAVSLAEFGENRDVDTQGQSDARYASGEREQSFGPWQIHLPAHPDVTRSCALDLTCSTEKAFAISKGGTDFGPWSAFTSGSYLRFVTEFTKPLADAVASASPSPSPSPSSSPSPESRGGGPPPQPPYFGLDRDVYRKIADRLDFLSIDVVLGRRTAAEAAQALRSAFPEVPAATLQAITYERGGRAGTEGNDIPGVKGTAAAVDSLKNAATGLDFVKGLFATENLWRAGFVVLGSALIFFGARLYFTADAASEQVSA